MEKPRKRTHDDSDTALGECLVCEYYCFDEHVASLFIAFQCQDGEDLLYAVYHSRLQDVKDILRRSPKCISYMGKDNWSKTSFKCEHGNIISK